MQPALLGATGRGVHEYCGVMDRVDIITGTLAKRLAVAQVATPQLDRR